MKRLLRYGAVAACLALLGTSLPAKAQQCSGATGITVHTSANITGSETWSASTVHVMQNVIEVKDGGVLTVEEGACVFADTNLEPSTLIVRRGGQLIADGTPSAPIVFSSANNTEFFDVGTTYQDDPGNPARGDWGGIVMIGNGNCNGAGDTTDDTPADGVARDCEVEGVDSTVPGLEDFDAVDADGLGRLTFGGDPAIPGGQGLDNSESSGSLKYARIEYAGFDLLGFTTGGQNSGNELNVLVLAGVGSGTTIENVHVRYGLDDGVEIFGGGVNLKNIVFSNIGDDSFDYSYGWDGDAQFLLIQLPDTVLADGGDRGFEVDGNEAEFSGDGANDYNLTPLTKPNIYNVTIIGDGDSRGMTMRRGTGGLVQNGLAADLATGLDVDDAETFARCTGTSAGDLFLDNFTMSNGTGVPAVGVLYDTDSDIENSCTGAGFQIGLTGLPVQATDRTSPNFQPIGQIPGATPPSNGFFDTSATFRGAVPAGGTPFYLLGSWVRF